jgi:dTDP-glucose pyrophosphorylase
LHIKKQLWQSAILPINSSIAEAISNLDRIGLKIILIVDDKGVFQGTVSDGDIRRGLLKGLDLQSRISTIVHRNALVVPPELERDLVLQIMFANKIQQIPVVDNRHNIVGLHLWDEITKVLERANLMVIMAGGIGKRLHPFTENCPKPLLKVAGKPILEHIIERAKLEGFSKFLISVFYLGHMIEDYFGDGSRIGVDIQYLREESPLGTAGALSLISQKLFSPFVVTNGDVMTDIRYGELIDFHLKHNGIGTMAVRSHEWQHPYGVVELNGVDIVGFKEKPITRNYINAGVYVLEPEALSLLTINTYCDMPTLFEFLQKEKKVTVAYPMHEPWLDVGKPDDLKNANKTIINKYQNWSNHGKD